MNRMQIICPIAAMLIFAFVVGVIFTNNERKDFLRRRAMLIGHELIKTTNSPGLVSVGSGLHDRLSQFLASPAHVENITLGDEPAPIGDKTATVRVFLKNEAAESLAIRLRYDPDIEKHHVLGYWTPLAPTNRPPR